MSHERCVCQGKQQSTDAWRIFSVNLGSVSGGRMGWKERRRAGNRIGIALKAKMISKKEK